MTIGIKLDNFCRQSLGFVNTNLYQIVGESMKKVASWHNRVLFTALLVNGLPTIIYCLPRVISLEKMLLYLSFMTLDYWNTIKSEVMQY